MAVRIRLARFGTNSKPCYRIVAQNSQAKRDGRYLELLGTYQSRVEPAAVKLNAKRVEYWLSVGAKPTETVATLLAKHMPKEAASEKTAAPKTPEKAPDKKPGGGK